MDITQQPMLLPRQRGLFLRDGVKPMGPTKWNVWALLVDGGLANVVHAGVAKGVEMDVAVGVMEEHVKPGSKLGPVERHVALARAVPVEEANVASVVKSAAAVEPPHLAAIIAEETHKLLAEFGGDVLSGKLPKEPPVRGPYGMARIAVKPGAAPKRQRCFQMAGERAEAVKQIMKEYEERGWIEPSCSEWGAPAFVVPKKEKGQWRLVVDYRALNAVTGHDS